MSTKWRVSGVLAAAILGFSACGTNEPEATVDVVPAGEQPVAETSDAAAAPANVSVGNCAGRYTGRFDGGESGVLAVAVGGNGSVVTSAYPGLDVGYSDDGFIRIDGATGSVEVGPDGIIVAGGDFVNIGNDGLVIGGDGTVIGSDGTVVIGDGEVSVDSPDGTVVVGEDGDVSVDSSDGTVVVGEDGEIVVDSPDGTVVIDADGGVTIDPDGPTLPRREGVTVGPGGISIQGGDGSVVVTSGTGQVGDDGLVSIVTDDGRVLSGTFDWTTCTGSGTWTESGVNGTWQVAQDTAQLHVPDSACEGTVFVGTGDDVLVGPGGVVVGSGGASVGSGAVSVTPEGVSIGSGTVNLDAVCASQAIATAQPAAFDEVDDSVTVQEGEGFTSYGVNGDLLFAFNSSDVDAAAQATLDGIVASVSERYPGAPIQILGHTDSIGSEQANIELSQARAQSVAVIVGGDDRLAGTPVETFGLGESSPVAANANPDGTDNAGGRALNRRVDIVVQTN